MQHEVYISSLNPDPYPSCNLCKIILLLVSPENKLPDFSELGEAFPPQEGIWKV